MATELSETKQEHSRNKTIRQGGASEAVYGLGLIGALIYYIGHAATFWLVLLGICKAIVWPAMLVFEVLKYMHM